ncbi:MAG: Ig-like domain-containing protein [Clostridia bacterium]|nr:Ig-like domain-containing protein [Clostridia bacterium]
MYCREKRTSLKRISLLLAFIFAMSIFAFTSMAADSASVSTPVPTAPNSYVRITEPLDKSYYSTYYNSGFNFPVKVSAYSSDGVEKVELYHNGTKMGERFEAPYEFTYYHSFHHGRTWNYTEYFQAVAITKSGRTVSSDTITVGIYSMGPGPTPITVEGYIAPGLLYNPDKGETLKSGFKVYTSSWGKEVTAYTDSKGYFKMEGVLMNYYQGVFPTIVISKDNYLTREVRNVGKGGFNVISTSAAPIEMWAGDIGTENTQDRAINMEDIVKLIAAFNTTPSDENYDSGYDFDQDQAINMQDILIIISHFNTTSQSYPEVLPSTPTPMPTPIP